MGDHEILASMCKEMGLDVDTVTRNGFTKFEDGRLVSLYLSENQLTTVPDSVTKLSNLTSLSLSDNQLSTVPDSISQLSNLTSLYLSGNQLTTVPDSISQLSKLTWLNLSENQLTTVPDSISQLSKLEWLYLYDNPLPDHLAKRFSGKDLQHLLEELSQQRTKRIAEEQAARERQEQQRLEQERAEKKRLERERLEQQRITQFQELSKLPIAGGIGQVSHPDLAKEWGMSMEEAYDLMVRFIREGKLAILRQEGETHDNYDDVLWVAGQQDAELEENLKTLEKILNRYDSIELNKLAALLSMEELQLERWLLELPDETNSSFRIDNTMIIIDQGTINQHIAALLQSFKTKTGKR